MNDETLEAIRAALPEGQIIESVRNDGGDNPVTTITIVPAPTADPTSGTE